MAAEPVRLALTGGSIPTAWARTHMAACKLPRSVEFMGALPRSGAGRILWRLLQAREAGVARRG